MSFYRWYAHSLFVALHRQTTEIRPRGHVQRKAGRQSVAVVAAGDVRKGKAQMFGIICGPYISPELADSYRIEPKTEEGRRLKETPPYRFDPETEARVIAECNEVIRQNGETPAAATRRW